MGWRVCNTSTRWLTKVKHTYPQPVTELVSRVWFPYSTQICGFKNIWSRHLVKQLWPPEEDRGAAVRNSRSERVRAFYLTRKWIDPSEWWWREERLTNRESQWLPGGIQSGLTNDWEQWVWCFLSVRHLGLIPVYQKNSCTLLFSGLRSP